MSVSVVCYQTASIYLTVNLIELLYVERLVYLLSEGLLLFAFLLKICVQNEEREFNRFKEKIVQVYHGLEVTRLLEGKIGNSFFKKSK